MYSHFFPWILAALVSMMFAVKICHTYILQKELIPIHWLNRQDHPHEKMVKSTI